MQRHVSQNHLATVDVLRGVAAMSVCLFHFTNGGLPKIVHEPLKTMFSWGWSGVEIFFVISGFIIPFVLAKGDYRMSGSAPFLLKRIVRICPPSYAAITLLVGEWFLIDAHTGTAKYTAALTPGNILHNVLYTIPFTDHRWFNGVFWTLAIEMQFYIVLGLFFRFVTRGTVSLLLAHSIGLAVDYAKLVPSQSLFDFSSLFVLGTATMMLKTGRIELRSFALVAAVATISAYFQTGSEVAALMGLAAGLVIAFAEVDNPVGRFFGMISYSLYLLHIPIGTTVEGVLTKTINPSGTIGSVLVLSICLAVTVAASFAFYLGVEKHFIELSRRVFSRKVRSEAGLAIDRHARA